MANIETHYTYVTDKTITSSGYTTISGAKIAKTNFTNGDRYLLKITAQCRGFSANGLYGIRPCTDNGVVQALIAVHSSFVFEPAHGSSFYTFEFVYVWTANSTQDIILQAKASTGTHYIEAITMLAMNLDDSNAGWTKGVEWDWAETDADTDLTTSWSSTNNASVTLPGATQSGDYLVLSSGQIDSNSTSSSCESGAAATNGGTPTADRTILQEGEDTSELMYHTVAELLENVSSNTDRYQESRNDSASKGKRTVSRIFYLYLDALNKHGAIQKTTSTDLGVASFTEHLSLSYTEGSPADYWIVFGWALSFGDVNDFLYFRLQVDGTSVPENRDADYGPVLWDADDRLPSSHCIRTNESLDTSIDIDGKTTNVGTGHDLDEGVIVVFSTELPTTGIIVTP
ncbi:MAG: hypothetical protein GTO14_17985, partial [Anaerolineales bacterium]|nr:hypothetical protein [Anaerolineales bacterium]